MKLMFEYSANVLRVLDGDTVELSIDLGFKISIKHTIRLYGIDTPELRDQSLAVRAIAEEAKRRVISLLQNPTVKLCTFKPYPDDKYGRWVGDIVNSDNISISEILLSEGLASAYRS